MKTSTSFKYILQLFILTTLIAQTMPAQITNTMHIERGWNLLSLPVKIGDVPISVTFPTAESDAFLWENEYMHRDTIDNGVGFWLKFDSAETVTLNGEAIHRDTVNVTEGWNMIGSITEILHVDMIRTEPPGIIISDYFSYSPSSGYEASEFIIPGLGYWVKVNQSGSVILSAGPPCPGIPTVTYGGKVYNTIQIGSQCWLKENLDIGTMILGSDTAKDNGIIEKYCYNNDTSNCNTYGGLYQWNEAMQYTTTPGTKGICPPGWHIPTYSDYHTLKTIVGDDGNALKAIGQGIPPDGEGTNTSGFSALLAGCRSNNGNFFGLYAIGFFGGSPSSLNGNASLLRLQFSIPYVYIDGYDYYDSYKEYGFGIRCLKDSVITQNIPCPGTPTVEYEGKTYNTVQIGNQCWLKENLDVGTMIQGGDTAKDDGIIEKYCYSNDTVNCSTFGGLYQWDEAMQYSTEEGAQGICPSGWHLPTFTEFQALSITVHGDGNTLKAIGQGYGDGAGTNISGFTALLAGGWDIDVFFGLSSATYFWSSTEDFLTTAKQLILYDQYTSLYLGSNGKATWISIRCLQD